MATDATEVEAGELWKNEEVCSEVALANEGCIGVAAAVVFTGVTRADDPAAEGMGKKALVAAKSGVTVAGVVDTSTPRSVVLTRRTVRLMGRKTPGPRCRCKLLTKGSRSKLAKRCAALAEKTTSKVKEFDRVARQST
jgi:hypothetical protein